MLRSVYTKTLRDMRWGVMGWGIGLGVLSIVYAFSWATAYPDEASRQQLANQIQGGLSAVQAFYGPAINVQQLGGFIEWRLFGIVPVLLGLYLILAITGMTRGAEESGVAETVSATAPTRGYVARRQIAAAATGAVIAAALLGLLTMGSGMFIGEPAPRAVRVAEESANIGGRSAVLRRAWAACGATVSETTERGGSGNWGDALFSPAEYHPAGRKRHRRHSVRITAVPLYKQFAVGQRPTWTGSQWPGCCCSPSLLPAQASMPQTAVTCSTHFASRTVRSVPRAPKVRRSRGRCSEVPALPREQRGARAARRTGRDHRLGDCDQRHGRAVDGLDAEPARGSDGTIEREHCPHRRYHRTGDPFVDPRFPRAATARGDGRDLWSVEGQR